ncbi:hypothetical protein FA95DRAFT_1575724 [Auriscalpium vulgare]|uniref:Uncharacterized protein n=1 Tax=Auriscalpium vulgare TaxID=40419 RepID=A0ACB8RFP7_9AGAM|nr:hypothetical protein FA95DRAFT_1575724 [Auriscalpium vulgare]
MCPKLDPYWSTKEDIVMSPDVRTHGASDLQAHGEWSVLSRSVGEVSYNVGQDNMNGIEDNGDDVRSALEWCVQWSEWRSNNWSAGTITEQLGSEKCSQWEDAVLEVTWSRLKQMCEWLDDCMWGMQLSQWSECGVQVRTLANDCLEARSEAYHQHECTWYWVYTQEKGKNLIKRAKCIVGQEEIED